LRLLQPGGACLADTSSCCCGAQHNCCINSIQCDTSLLSKLWQLGLLLLLEVRCTYIQTLSASKCCPAESHAGAVTV
jgi:hypothetical protein